MSSPVVEPLDPAALQRYADVELILVDWLLAALGGPLNLKVSNELPPGVELDTVLAEYDAFVHVEAFGGADKNAAQDVARGDVDVYKAGDGDGNPDRGGAMDIAELIRSALLFRLPGFYTATATVSAVATISRPTARPYDDNPTTRKIGAAYQFEIKSRG